MKRKEKRTHVTLNSGRIASLFINEVRLPKEKEFKDCTYSIKTSYYEYIGACVTRDKKLANDWWNDRKNVLPYCTDTLDKEAVVVITDLLTEHVDQFLRDYGYYCFVFKPEDDLRRIALMRGVDKYCKKNNLCCDYVIIEFTSLLYYIQPKLPSYVVANE